MSTNNMENPEREGSDRKKQYCPGGNASKNERRLPPQANEAQIRAEYSDQDSNVTIIDINMEDIEPDSPEEQGLVLVFGNSEEPSDSLMEQILNTVRKHFGPGQPPNEQQVIPESVEAEKDASKNKHWPQPKVKLEAEDSDQDLRKTMSEFKVKGVKPDSSRGQRVGPVTGDLGESVKGKNPAVLKYEHGVQLNANLARLETDSLRRYLRHFKIEGVDSDSSREKMLNAVQQHFASQQPLNERQVIPEFIDAARRLKNKHIKNED